MFVAPVKVFVPESTQVPVPFLVTVPVDVPIIPDIVPVPSPFNVKLKAPETAPLQVKFPEEVAAIVLADPKVIAPLKVAARPVLVKAPAGDAVNPVPLIVNASGVDEVFMEYPFRSKTAPAAIVVPATLDPNGPLSGVLPVTPTPNFKVPALMVVAPL